MTKLGVLPQESVDKTTTHLTDFMKFQKYVVSKEGAALEIRKNGWWQKIAIVNVLRDGSSVAKISTCVFCCFNH